MSERHLREVLANGHRANDLHNIAGGLANVLNQGDQLQVMHQMARLLRALAAEAAALRTDVTKLAAGMLEERGPEG